MLEDDRGDKVDNTEVIKSLTEGSTLDGDDGRSDSSRDRDKKGSSKHSHKDKEKGRERRSTRSYRSSSRERYDGYYCWHNYDKFIEFNHFRHNSRAL